MKVNQAITKDEMQDLKTILPNFDLDTDFNDDEWDELVDVVQDKAIEMLQSNDKKAAYFDDIAAKISAYEY